MSHSSHRIKLFVNTRRAGQHSSRPIGTVQTDAAEHTPPRVQGGEMEPESAGALARWQEWQDDVQAKNTILSQSTFSGESSFTGCST